MKSFINVFFFFTFIMLPCMTVKAKNDIQKVQKKVGSITIEGLQFNSKINADILYFETKNYLKKYKVTILDSANFSNVYGTISEISNAAVTLLFEFKKQKDSLNTVWCYVSQHKNTLENDALLAKNSTEFIKKLQNYLQKKDSFKRLGSAEHNLLMASKKELKTIKKIDLLIKEANSRNSQIEKLQTQLFKIENQCHDLYTELEETEKALKKMKKEVKDKQQKVEEIKKEIRALE